MVEGFGAVGLCEAPLREVEGADNQAAISHGPREISLPGVDFPENLLAVRVVPGGLVEVEVDVIVPCCKSDIKAAPDFVGMSPSTGSVTPSWRLKSGASSEGRLSVVVQFSGRMGPGRPVSRM